MEHRESDEDLVDKFEFVTEEDEANWTISVPRVKQDGNKEWSRNINLRDDLDFDQPTDSRIEEDMEAVNFFRFILLTQCGTISWTRPNYTPSRREGLWDDQSGNALTLDEFKAGVALTLNMGVMNKPSLRL